MALPRAGEALVPSAGHKEPFPVPTQEGTAGPVPASGLPCTIGFPVETLGHLMDPIQIGDMALAKLPKQSNIVRDQNGLRA